ncbi:alpha/beta hydrolase, partial [Pelomonas sp. HMWF004]
MPDQPVERQPTSCTAAGLRWGLRRAGAPGAPRLLLIHGTGSSGASWAAVAERLAGQFDMLLPDLPGHGGTHGFADRHASLPRMAEALAGLLGHLGWAPDLIAGHSAGAAVMLQLALTGRVPQARGLLSLNGALQPLPGLLGAVAPTVARLASRSHWLPTWV